MSIRHGGSTHRGAKGISAGAKDQKLEDAWKHTAQFEGASEEVTHYLKSRVQRILKLSEDGWGFEIIEEKISGDCAVIITNESKKAGKKAFDIDPVFMIKQDDVWKVMPELTQWDMSGSVPVDKQPASMKLDERKTVAYKELEKWVDERTEALKKKRKP